MKLITNILFLIFIFGVKANAQNSIEQYIEENAFDLDNILSEEFLLKENPKLSKLFEGVDIILMGEQNHGDGNVFELKTRLIEYLYNFHGFEVVLFETDFYGGYKASENQGIGQESIDKFKKTVFPFWSRTEQMELFWSFVSKTHQSHKPLYLAGFDVHHYSKYSKENLADDFENFVQKHIKDFSKEVDMIAFLATLKKLLAYKVPENDKEKADFFNSIDAFIRILNSNKDPEIDFWIQELNNLKYAAHFAWSQVYRDKGMAENIIWLKEKIFKEKKVIVWAQNAHIFKEVESWHLGIDGLSDRYKAYEDKEMGIAMGKVLSDYYNEKLFSLGVLSYQGSYSSKSFVNDFDTKEKISGEDYLGLAKYLHEAKISYGILPIDKERKDLFYMLMNGSGHNFESLAKWYLMFDAIFYTDEVHPLSLKPR